MRLVSEGVGYWREMVGSWRGYFSVELWEIIFLNAHVHMLDKRIAL